jgi:glycerol-3-phosphate acyltransferase PlsY
VVVASRYSSLGAVVAAFFAPVATYFLTGSEPFLMATVAMGALLLWRHEANIRKLLRGEERRIGEPKDNGAEQPG